MKFLCVLGGLAAVLTTIGCGRSVSVTGPSAVAVAEGSQASGVATSSARASADAMPFRGTFEGTQTVTPLPPFPPTSASVAVSVSGTANAIGLFSMELPHTVDFTTSTAIGTATITAANGDVIVASFTGLAVLGPIVSITEHATVVSGTGRFAGATGEFTIARQFNPALGITTGTFSGVVSAPGAVHP